MSKYNREKEEIRKELHCIIHPLNSLKTYKYVAICTFYNGKIVLSKHKIRSTWETQGGHIEDNELPIDAAKRELFEESGIQNAEIYPICDYYGYDSKNHSNGMVFVAIAHSFSALPEFEMKEVSFFNEIPLELTYPNVTPVFFQKAKLFCEKNNLNKF